jgi:hypothetical protein
MKKVTQKGGAPEIINIETKQTQFRSSNES